MESVCKITEIKSFISSVEGKVGVYYKELVSSKEIKFSADDIFPSASVIKLPLCAAILRMAENGEVELYERLPVREEDAVPSMGTLHMLAGEIESLTVETLCRIMINTSDNTATNILIKRFGFDKLNYEFEQMGLEMTRLRRLMMDSVAVAEGRENYISAAEVGMMLERIYHRALISDRASAFLERCLLEQQFNQKLSGLLRGIRVAHKTGENYRLTHDAAIVYAQNPFVIVVLTSDTETVATDDCMRRLALKLCEGR